MHCLKISFSSHGKPSISKPSLVLLKRKYDNELGRGTNKTSDSLFTTINGHKKGVAYQFASFKFVIEDRENVSFLTGNNF